MVRVELSLPARSRRLWKSASRQSRILQLATRYNCWRAAAGSRSVLFDTCSRHTSSESA